MTKDKIDFDDLQYDLSMARQLSQGDRQNVKEAIGTFTQKIKGLTKQVNTIFKLIKELKDNQEVIAKALHDILLRSENKELWIEVSKEDKNGKSL